ncbi:hypothetical protein REPUB_Repub16aG0090700 [Reevesia pubescens]
MEAVISIVGSILGSLAGKAAEYTVDPIAQQLSYLFKPKSKFQNFRDQLQKLKDARERVQQKVNEAKRNGEEIFNDVDRWLTDVNGKISEEAALQFQEDEEKAKKRCFVVLCPNFKSRYQLSRKAEKEANTIAQLLEQNGKFDLVSYPAAPEGVATRPVKDYEDFESRTGAFNAVMEALKDSNLSIIGVYGMGGVGKTTLVKQVARQAKEENLFDEVVMATVTQSFDISRIQDQIAEELGGKKLDKQSDAGRAGELRNRLKNSKKVLVILDDVWVKLDLEAVGIPYGAEHKGCKILLTSRELRVLSLTKSQQNLAVDVLTEDEAWSLFEKMAGDIVLSPDLYPIATEVAKKCAGLPIAIVTVGKGMENKKNAYEWRSALQDLIRPSKRNFKGISADVYSAIELSYKFLEDEEHRPTFLLCSVMGHNAVIEDLLIYGKGLGIFHGVDSIQEARDKVLTLVSNLKASCLLLDGSTPKYSDRREHFDMHDVVRDVAISISSRDQHWLALGRDDVFKEWSDEETMRRCNLISLRDAKVSELPDELECPNLTFFSMVSENSSLKIPDNFFKGMQRLKVLDFAKMHFSSLPLSISSLKNLHTLCFSWCTLEDIAIIGELKNLEILNLRGSTTATLPREIGQLTKLKLLDLSWCDNLEVISANVLSSLSSLEELYLYDSFDGWEVEVEGHDNPRSNASLVELNNLSHLTTLEVHIPNHQAMPKDHFFLQKLERYKISIGEKWDWLSDKLEISRMLKVELNESINLYDGVKMLQKIENLCLNGVKNVENILYDPNTLRFSQLKTMKVRGCDTLKNLFSVSVARGLCQLQEIEVSDCRNITKIVADEKEGNIGDIEESGILEFPQLRTLKLMDLPELKIFYSAEERVSSSRQEGIQSTIDASSDVVTPFFNQKVAFPAIKELELHRCINLKYVFTSSTVKSFVQLKTLQISWCTKIEEVISVTQGLVEEERVVFPRLEHLHLHRLPNLKRFCCGSPIEFRSLKKLQIKYCDVLSTFHCDCTSSVGKSSNISTDHNLRTHIRLPLFNHKFTFPDLEILELGLNDGMKEIWHACGQQLVTDYLCKLKDVQVRGTPKKFAIIPLDLLRLLSLPNLEKLQIRNAHCKEIFQSEGVGGEEMPASAWVVLSRVIELRLTHLSELMHLWKEKEGFQNLRILDVKLCPKLKFFLVPSSVSFQNLVTLKVQKCGGITKLITHSTAKTLVQLKEMSITDCDKMNEIIEGCGGDEDEVKIEISFPQLNSLELRYLPKLESFCSSGNYSFAFPSLEKVKVKDCPKMKMFSQGDSNTSMLQCVRFCKKRKDDLSWEGVRYYWRWEGNLNSTIQQLFKERNENPVVEEYKYSDEFENDGDFEELLKFLEEHQDNPSTSNTKNSIEEVHNSIEDQGNPSTSNTQ